MKQYNQISGKSRHFYLLEEIRRLSHYVTIVLGVMPLLLFPALLYYTNLSYYSLFLSLLVFVHFVFSKHLDVHFTRFILFIYISFSFYIASIVYSEIFPDYSFIFHNLYTISFVFGIAFLLPTEKLLALFYLIFSILLVLFSEEITQLIQPLKIEIAPIYFSTPIQILIYFITFLSFTLFFYFLHWRNIKTLKSEKIITKQLKLHNQFLKNQKYQKIKEKESLLDQYKKKYNKVDLENFFSLLNKLENTTFSQNSEKYFLDQLHLFTASHISYLIRVNQASRNLDKKLELCAHKGALIEFQQIDKSEQSIIIRTYMEKKKNYEKSTIQEYSQVKVQSSLGQTIVNYHLSIPVVYNNKTDYIFLFISNKKWDEKKIRLFQQIIDYASSFLHFVNEKMTVQTADK